VIGALFRIYSYLYHIALSLLLLALAVIALQSPSHTLKLEMLPWTGEMLTRWLLGLGFAGLISVFLALIGKLRALFLLWTIAAFVLMLRGYFLGSYVFSGQEEFRYTVIATFGALLAIVGALSAVRKKTRKKRR
jgi:hypothetical protein